MIPSTAFSSRLLDETYHRAKLPCGLTAYVFPKQGMQRKLAVFGTLYGSIDNDFRHAGAAHSMPHGIAHFLEHQLFKKEKGDLLVEFSKKGANSNAGTEYSTTVYYFSCIDNFHDNLATLTELVFQPVFRPDWVAKEKLIIEQELRMYRDMPDFRIYQNLQESLYRVHPARVDIGGTVESIQAITPAQLEQCWRTFYAPSNMVLAAAGDVDPQAVFEQAERAVAGFGLPRNGRIARAVPREPRDVREPRRREAMQVARPKFLMAWKETDPKPNGPAAIRREIELNLALEAALGRGSRLYDRLYSRGLLDESFSTSYSAAPTFGATVMGGESDEPEALEKGILAGLGKFLSEGIRRRDLDRIRRKYLGAFLRGFDQVDPCAFALLRAHFRRFNVFDLPKLVRHVTARDILRAARSHFGERNRAVSIVVPK